MQERYASQAENMGGPGAALVRQVLRVIPVGLLALFAGSVAVLGFRALGRAQDVPISFLTRDPAAITDSLWSLGAQSTFGIILWAATTGILLLGGALLWPIAERRRSTWFLWASGALSLLLTVDDAYLLHEDVLPSIGIPELGVYALYLLVAAVYAAVFYRELLASDYLLLVASGLAIAASLVIDMVFQNVSIFFEDGFKVYAAVFWLVFWTRTTVARVREGLAAPTASRGAAS
ncbi:MAG: hypothetical protein GX649_06550 [Chloroflexi bacterium]|nr:hypothetical protein [Chloroflexota bacterium]